MEDFAEEISFLFMRLLVAFAPIATYLHNNKYINCTPATNSPSLLVSKLHHRHFVRSYKLANSQSDSVVGFDTIEQTIRCGGPLEHTSAEITPLQTDLSRAYYKPNACSSHRVSGSLTLCSIAFLRLRFLVQHLIKS